MSLRSIVSSGSVGADDVGGRVAFTVFTPTFRRRHTLGRVYRSLLAQTRDDFEWIIVDDGSDDGTDGIVQEWIGGGRIAIRYIRQPNSGKHVAFNRAVRVARGELFVPLDSDDECVPTALERFWFHWVAIPKVERERYFGILCLCRSEEGELLGGPLPRPVIDGRSFEVLSQLRRSAEMWIAIRTDILRAYPFPEYPSEKFVPEGLVWNRIGRRYLARFIDEGLRVYFRSSDSLSRSNVQIRLRSPRATLTYYAEAMDLPVRLSLRLRAACNLWRFAIGSGRPKEAIGASVRHPVLAILGLVPGVLLSVRDRAVNFAAQRVALRHEGRG